MTMKKVKNLILGGGFAGLFLATKLEDAFVLDGDSHLGGLLHGFMSESGKFTFDIGGHVYTTKDPELNEIMESAGAKLFPERKAYFDFQQRIPYPLQYHADKFVHPVSINPKPLDHYENFEEFLIHEFGSDLYWAALGPFNERVWTIHPRLMSADWIMGRVPTMNQEHKSWGPNSSFYYARGLDIINVLLNRIEMNGGFGQVNTTVRSINYVNKIVHTISASKFLQESFQYENLFDTTGNVIDNEAPNSPHNNVITIGVGLDREIDDDFHWWYNGINRSPIHRITLLSRYHERLAPYRQDSLLIEIPYIPEKQTPIAEVVRDKVGVHGIVSLLNEAHFPFDIRANNIEEVVHIKSRGYPIPVIGHRETVASVRKEMAKYCVYLVGRWGARGYYNLDHIIKDANAAIHASMGLIDPNDYEWANYYYHEKRKVG